MKPTTACRRGVAGAGKAGTIEQVHRVLKDELTAALDRRYRNARPKRLRFAIFTQFGRVVWHAHRRLIRLANLVWEVLVVPGRRKLAASMWPAP